MVAHGGAGVVTPTGRIGPLQLDHSTPVAVQRFAGPADYLGIGVFRSGGITPRFLALGYQCRRVRNGGIPTSMDDGKGSRHPRLSGVDCVTVYYVNERTNELALFTSRSPRFVTSLGTRPGMAWARVKEHGHQYVNCGEVFVLRKRSSLLLTNIGGRGGGATPYHGGRVFDVGAESKQHPLGLECPDW